MFIKYKHLKNITKSDKDTYFHSYRLLILSKRQYMDYASTYPNFTYSFIKETPKNTPKKELIKSVFAVYQYNWALKLPLQHHYH